MLAYGHLAMRQVDGDEMTEILHLVAKHGVMDLNFRQNAGKVIKTVKMTDLYLKITEIPCAERG